MNLVTLVDEYLYEVARLHSPSTELKYSQLLKFLLQDLGEKAPIDQITESDVVVSLSRWKNRSRSTQYLSHQVYENLFRYAVKKRKLDANPMQHLERPKRPRPEDTEVVSITREEVAQMFFSCRNWGDEVCLGVLAYTGSRRNAVSMIRWKDVDLREDPPYGPYGWIKLREKGGKYTEKPIPFLLRQILDRAPEHDPEDYLVPNLRPSQVTRKERKNSIIYDRIKKIAERAGVKATVHAIRAAFAVTFLEANRGNIKGLQDLLGHTNIQTTQTYLRKFGKKESMVGVVDLSYGDALVDGEHGQREAILGSWRGSLVAPSASALSEGGRGHLPEAGQPGGVESVGNAAFQPPSLSALNGAERELPEIMGVVGSQGIHPPVSPNREAAAPLSALSEGEVRGSLSVWDRTPNEASPGSPSESALTGSDVRGQKDVPLLGTGDHAAKRSLPVSATVATMTRQESDVLSQDDSDELSREVLEAHTGFEPVSLQQASNHRPMTGARHVARHGRPGSAILGHGS